MIVVALGGNALLRRGEPLCADVQEANVASAAETLSTVARGHRLVVTHGNGPQVGLLALQNDAYKDVAPFPLDVLDAESEGMIGYLLDRHLANNLPGRDIATLLTQVLVDANDPAMTRPTKPIGPVYDEDAARHLTAHRHWVLARDGAGWRRVVPSPAPQEIIELSTIRLLVERGVVVVCAGGGGIPVVRDSLGVRGVEAVIDKDATSALLARELGASQLLLLTDVRGIAAGWGTSQERWLRLVAPETLRSLSFPAGSMGPKVSAVCDFVENTGRRATIGALDDLPSILAGEAGTTVLPKAGVSYYLQGGDPNGDKE